MLNDELVLFADELANVSGGIIKKYYRNKIAPGVEKKDYTPVTICDLAVERALRDKIETKYPEHRIWGEEFGAKGGNSEYSWCLDPIDGTSSFVIGKPLFTTLIAICYEEKPIFGLVDQPILKERWQGGDGLQSSFNRKEIKINNKTLLKDATLVTTSPYLFSAEESIIFDIVRKETKYQSYGGVFCGGDAYNYMLLTMGFVDVIIESGLKKHDFMALIPIIKGAGGVISDWQGNDLTMDSVGQVLVSGNQKLHKEVLALI